MKVKREKQFIIGYMVGYTNPVSFAKVFKTWCDTDRISAEFQKHTVNPPQLAEWWFQINYSVPVWRVDVPYKLRDFDTGVFMVKPLKSVNNYKGSERITYLVGSSGYFNCPFAE